MIKPNVGVIGLGAMGMGVARSLLRAGFTVAACDLRAEARAAIEAAGGSTDAPIPQPKPKREPKPVPPQALADAKPAKEKREPKEQAGEAKEAKVKREGAKPAPEGKKDGKS
jgi:3-hydroxyacyl-CoA dehydrogenase